MYTFFQYTEGLHLPEYFHVCLHSINFCAHFFQNDHYEPSQWEDVIIDPLSSHVCADKKVVVIQAIDEHGMASLCAWVLWTSFEFIGLEHKVQFISCGCESLAVTMTRAELWPATPTNPRCAFTFALLDWAEALLLEAQVSLQDFCKSLKFRCPFFSTKVELLFGFCCCVYCLLDF